MSRLAFLVLFALFSVWALFRYSDAPAEPAPLLEIQDSEFFAEPALPEIQDSEFVEEDVTLRATERDRNVTPLKTEETYDESDARPPGASASGRYGGRGGRGGTSRNIPQFAEEIAASEFGAAGEDRSIANPIRHGSPSRFDPAAGHVLGEVNSKEIYRAIPEFKRISEENVERGSALWARLMQGATRSFKETLRAAASEHGTPLIVELGRRGELGLDEGLDSVDLTTWCIRKLND